MTFQKKNIICDTSILNNESPYHPLKIFKLLNKRKDRSNNVEKIALVFPQTFCQTLGALVCLLGITKA